MKYDQKYEYNEQTEWKTTHLPSSAWSVPLVQKCSWPIPGKLWEIKGVHHFQFHWDPETRDKFDISVNILTSKLYFLPFPLPLQKRPIPHSCQKQTPFSKSNLRNHVAKKSRYHLRSNIFDQWSGRAHCFHNFDTHQSSCFNIYGNQQSFVALTLPLWSQSICYPILVQNHVGLYPLLKAMHFSKPI